MTFSPGKTYRIRRMSDGKTITIHVLAIFDDEAVAYKYWRPCYWEYQIVRIKRLTIEYQEANNNP